MRTFIRASQTLLIVAFFLPFVRVCSTKMTKSIEISSTDSLLAEDTIPLTDDTATIDTILINSPLSTNSNDSMVINHQDSTSTKQSIIMNIFEFLASPDYMDGLVLTGFGYSVSIVSNAIERKIIMDIESLAGFLIPISFVLSIIVLFVPLRKIKLSTTLSLIGFSCMLIMSGIFIIEEDLEGMLFGLWIALALYFLNAMLLFMGLKKKIEI